jgi:hypothetical protein
VVRIVVDRDIVAVPKPIPAVACVKRRDIEEVAAEPKTPGTASFEPPDVAAAKASIKAAVFPWMVDMEAGIFAAPIVADPCSVAVDMRVIGMVIVIAKRSMLISRRTVKCCGTTARNVSTSEIAMFAMLPMLCESWESERHAYGYKNKAAESHGHLFKV